MTWDVAKQVGSIGAFLLLYKIVIVAAGRDVRSEAVRHGRQIISIERFLGIYNELSVQDVFIPAATWLVRVFNFYYGSVHFAATISVLIWLYFAKPNAYRAWRNMLAAVSVLSISGYWFYPVAPPRMFPGYVDTLQAYGGIWSYKTGVAETLANQYAAMPSLHTGWSMWCGLALFTLGRRRVVRLLGLLHPTFTVLGIVITGNHFWLDAVGGFAVVAVAVALCHRWLHPTVANGNSGEAIEPQPVGLT